jgi:hypothetical protein
LQKADYVFDSRALHHIEPFEDFSKILRNAVKPGGRLMKQFQMLDSYFFKFPKFRKYSYRQYLFLC